MVPKDPSLNRVKLPDRWGILRQSGGMKGVLTIHGQTVPPPPPPFPSKARETVLGFPRFLTIIKTNGEVDI